ncbi:MAG: SprT-like domain-containing protein [Acidobacteriota bacterium]
MFEHEISTDPENLYCEEGLDWKIFPEVYRGLRETDSVPKSDIRYFTYRNIKNTLRIRGGIIHIRISHMLRGAPAKVMAAIYQILICRTFRISGYHQASLIYNSYISSREFLGRKFVSRPCSSRMKKRNMAGRVADLGERFMHLNNHYFKGELRDLDLYWIERRSKRILGQFIPHRDEILINSNLDHPLVPVSVIDFILYHEMLHACLNPKISANGRKMVHHREFKRMERQFEGYRFANEFIKENF